MAIPISQYIDIKSKTLAGGVGTPDFSGLVFTKDSIKASAPAQTKTDYDAGKVLAFTLDQITEYFADTTKVYGFAQKYFGGYGGGNTTPQILNVVKSITADTTAKVAYTRVTGTDGFQNFGAFAFLGETDFPIGTSSSGGLAETAGVNEGSGHLMVVATTGTNESTAKTALAGLVNTALVISSEDDAEWMVLAWYASTNYSKKNASDTIDYRDFGNVPAQVTDAATKTTYDNDHVNYIGLVQVNGRELKFFQNGVTTNGTDIGVVRDKVWIEGEIASGWFALAGSQKIPANYAGSALVENMVVSVANKAVDNGCILVDKELDEVQIAQIVSITGDENAVAIVQSTGYYVKANIVKEGERYICEYTLVYAKGDHIGKVVGTNYLV